jgi:uncharacterized membrane protein YjjP (DUF1212 family)
MERSEFLKRVKFVSTFGKVLHSVGSPAHTIESTMQEMCDLLGIKGSFASMPTLITYSFSYRDEIVTKIDRVEPMGVNLSKLSEADLIARAVIGGTLTFEKGVEQLNFMLSKPGVYGTFIRTLCFPLSSAGFMVLFGGTWMDFLVATFIGLITGLLAHFRPVGQIGQIFETIVAVVASFLAYSFAKFFPGLNVATILLSGLIIFLPGLVVTIAIAEIATQNLTSGVSRLVGGLMVLLQLAYGVFIGNKLAGHVDFFQIGFQLPNISPYFVFLFLPLTSLLSTIIFKAEKEDWKWVTLAGIWGFLSSKYASEFFGPELGMFIGGMSVGAASNIFARIMNRPSSIFQFPGIILLVPGSVGYRSLNFLFEGNIVGGLNTAFTMIILAMSLVVGVFVGNILVRPRLSF